MPDAETSEVTGADLQIRHFTAPPAGFDPLTASDRELLIYGFPARPDAGKHPQLRERWERMFAKPMRRIEPQFERRPSHRHSPRRPAPGIGRQRLAGEPGTREAGAGEVGNETSGNWSGSVHYAAAGDSCTWVAGYWTVPDVTAPGNGDYYCATWIGIDGDGSPDVLQAGTEQEIVGGNRHTYAWWEWFPEVEVQITNLPVSPGDVMYCLICVHSSTSAGFYLHNQTTGDYASFTQSPPNGTSLVGNCAEWIVEAPSINGNEAALAGFADVFFDESNAGTKNGQTLNAGQGTPITMVDGSGNALASPTFENSILVKVARA